MPRAARRPYIRIREAPVKVIIDIDLCESTGVCAQVCPENVFVHEFGKTEVVKPEACTNCWICVDNCVACAIEID